MRKRILQLLLVCVCAFTMLGASRPGARLDHLGHELVCQCGCGQILLECNHVGCPVSGPMIDELKGKMAAGLSNTAILNWFTQKYGAVVLAAPIRGGFDLVAWIMPFAALGLGIAAVVILLRLWKRRNAALAPATPTAPSAADEALRDRIRRDTNYE